MVSSINSTVLSTLFGGASGDSGIGADLLTAWAASKAGVGTSTVADVTADKNAPIAPVWTPGYTPGDDALVARAVAGKGFFDTTAKLYSDLGATGDYKSLFALHTGISTLQALAAKMEDTTLSKSAKAQTQAQFERGLAELQQFFDTTQFENVRLAEGDRVDSAQTTLAIPSTSEDYTTGVIHRGSLSTTVAGLDKNAKFEIVATASTGNVRHVSIDLSEMGSIPRSLGSVVSFVNNKLSAAGVSSRLEAVDQTPKTTNVIIGGKVTAIKYTGSKQYALKVDVRANEKVAFNPVAADPAFYVVGDTSNGARLIKLTDTDGAPGQPIQLDRPAATADPIGALIAGGWLGAGAPYTAAPADANEQRTTALASAGTNSFADALHDAGEAVLKFQYDDGRTLSVSTAWRSDDLENWRQGSGETEDQGILNDLAERLTQLLHEQGVAAGVDVWQDGTNSGLSIFTADGLKTSSLTISGKNAALNTVAPSGMVGGLEDGVYARSFETAALGATGTMFVGKQSFTFTTTNATRSFSFEGGTTGITGADLVGRLNAQLASAGIHANASLVDNAGVMSVRIDALHDVTAVGATLNDDDYDLALTAPDVNVTGGLPNAYGGAVRTTTTAGSPLSDNTGALDIAIVVATATGDKTINVSVSAAERANDPDPAPGQWSQTFQDRLSAALNAAGVYAGATSNDLTQWAVAEDSGQRIASITVNGNALALTGSAPALGIGGALSAERSFTSAQAATGVSDDVAALISNPNVSITFDTVWGQKTVSAALQPGDPATLESAALRMNEALASAGYDLGVAATDLSGGGAGLRIISGASHTVRTISNIAIGDANVAATLEPIDAASHADDPVGTQSVAVRAARGAAVTETIPATSGLSAPANSSGWFPGRAFDVAVGSGSEVATARAVATGADGSVYVLADLDGDSATTPINGVRDVALFKYDSAGKLAFTRLLGSADTASGFALAVSADGKVAVAGSVEGGLSGAAAAKGGADSFVTVYDAKGSELWTARRGATGDDQVNAMSFASNGTLIVAGETDSSLGSALALGGSDAYVRGYATSGAELFTKQFGSGRDDTATALLVRDNGAGGFDIFTGGVEDNRGVVRSFTYAPSAGFSSGATRDIGYFYKGAINALASDGSSLYVGGQTGADRLTVANTARAAVAGQEGFVARIDVNLASAALDRATYLGSAQDDAVEGIAIVNGQVYAAGVTGGIIDGSGGSKVKQSFLARLDAAGDADWMRTFTSASGVMNLQGMAVDTGGASPLDMLGLPRGVVSTSDSGALVDKSALRVDDEFKIGVDGQRLTTIKIASTDSLSTLATRINRAIGGGGRAEIVKDNGVERLKITANNGKAVRIEPGRDGHNALTGLGLQEGVVAVNDASGLKSMKTFGLGLIAADLKIDTAAHISKTKAELSAAISIVRQAYEALLHPNAKPETEAEKALADKKAAAGAAPAYLGTQLANYKAALARLTGSS